MQRSRTVHHVTNQEITVAQCLMKHFKLGPEEVESLFKLGAIYSDKKRVLENRLLAKGTYLRVHLQPKRFGAAKIDWKSCTVADHADFLIVNKPPGIPVHASLENREENVLNQMRLATGYPLLITQRLDNPVGGLLCFAKTPSFQRFFNSALSERNVTKQYRALTASPPPLGLLTHYMEPTNHPPKNVVPNETQGWDICQLQVDTVTPHKENFDISLTLLTGRTHQIRSQLGAIGCSILGDRLYGSKTRYLPKQIALFSSRLEFHLENGDPTRLELSPPWA